MRMQRWAAGGLALLLSVGLLSGCGGNKDALQPGKLNVVTTFYPIYYLASEIGGEEANVVNLIPTGVEPHDWTPKSRDLNTASKAQLFLYNGAGLEGWVDDFLHGAGQKVQTVEVSHGIPLLDAQDGEGQEVNHDGHAHDDLHVDPHTWVSPKSMLLMGANVKEAFVKSDPAHRSAYEQRFEALTARLGTLDRQFADGLANVGKRDIVVSHQAFGYLCRDYGLTQTAVMGLSPDAEPRAQDLLRIAKFVKDNGVRTIFFEELVSDRIAKTLAEEANVGTMVLNPVEGLTSEEEKAGDDYVTLMERNLQNLQKALQ
ncbi:metal ABC transporter solute-binding protein, Zn/Mn family [Cohnella nanjingensis]|uniref:Zinc ABC transporter substrate-binding protein n=1 Tax=Cohnella nanjingensis TaxID=1387779 RepID=A0A7X0VIJ4_9BACL|nr:zinc ABC transporter substrate-binding protein [Cohnella nanjingensis]MBB6675262.1 zinc ABC transporter substrate-binding protein [Cohnella nanjingensis]